MTRSCVGGFFGNPCSMTLAIAWVGKRSDGREDLHFASDSRTRGYMVLDSTPKIMTLPRSDCAICFAGNTAATFPLVHHISVAIAAHQPALERNLDICELKSHLLRLCTDMFFSVADWSLQPEATEAQFIFGGYSWRQKEFRIWTFHYEPKLKRFSARPAGGFHPRLKQVAFIGDWATPFRASLAKRLNAMPTGSASLEPLQLLAATLEAEAPKNGSTIGGAPQLVRVGPHMNTRTFCVSWGTPAKHYLFGRALFDYERCDYWSIDPHTGKIESPKHFNLSKTGATSR